LASFYFCFCLSQIQSAAYFARSFTTAFEASFAAWAESVENPLLITARLHAACLQMGFLFNQEHFS